MKNNFLIFILSASFLVGCTANSSQTALPTVVMDVASQPAASAGTSFGGSVAASGIIAPQQEAQLAFIQGGILKTVKVKEGDSVKVGDVLAELDNAAIQRDLEQAQRNLMELTSPASQAAAAQALAVARQNLNDQQDKVNSQFYRRASDTLIDNTQGEIDLAKQALARASDTYRSVARLEDGDNRKAAALVAMTSAQLKLNDLIAKYNWYSNKPSDIDASLANAKLDVAKAAAQEAEWYLAKLKGENIPAEATGSDLARLETAKLEIETNQDRLDQSRLVAPIAGVVVKVNGVAGEIVSPGELLFSISDVTRLHVETTDLSERDVPNVKVGQAVMVSIKALNKSVPGHVTNISPVANTLGGDVVYKTMIELDSPPDGLLSGMSVDVQYQTSN